jgi:site-specific recombinase XerD
MDTDRSPVPLVGTALPSRAAGPAPQDQLLARLTQAWLNRHGSAHTFAAYRRDLTYWIGWCQARGLHPLDARIANVDDWLAEQRDVGVRPGADPASRRSIARRLSVISSWYDYLRVNTAADPQPLIEHNPAKGANRPDVDRDASPTNSLSRSEADRLIEAADADGPRSAAIVRLLLTNAYRCMDLLGAQIEGLSYDQGHRVLVAVIKGDHVAKDPLPPSTAEALDTYLAYRGNPTTGPIFVTGTGRSMDGGGLTKLLRRLCRLAGIPTAKVITPHWLRKTAISQALRATGDLRKGQQLAHHADPRTTGLYDDRGQLDDHAAYVLGTRYGVRRA